MTRTILPLFLAGFFSITTHQAYAADPAKVAAKYDRIYAPVGFDSNDHVQLVATGSFENACYRAAETKVSVDKEKKRITLSPAAYKYNGLCLQVVLRFERTVDVGILPKGTYEVYQADRTELLGKVDVREATSNEPDDHLYAPVSQAVIDEREDSPTSELVIKGEFPTNCMYIREVKLTVENDVIVAQPIVSVDQRDDCAMGFFPFRSVTNIMVSKGRYLLHVRSMNANAVNSLIQVP